MYETTSDYPAGRSGNLNVCLLKSAAVGVSVLAPVYIAEISPARWRGRLVGLFQFSIVFGILVAYLSNYLFDMANPGDLEWHVKLGTGALPAALFFSLLFVIPRSPRWLVKKGDVPEARDVLTSTGEENIEQDCRTSRLRLNTTRGSREHPFLSKGISSPSIWRCRLPCSTNCPGSTGCFIT